MSSVTNDSIIIHLFVVGFHHKKGCVVEYCYPPILKQQTECTETTDQNSAINVSTNDLPYVWKTLPQLSLPDGSHNHERDTIYFHLPDIDDHNQTIYGVSCYRQINVEKLIARTSDMTRGTVQKSVVVLSRLPLYGIITAKLEIITHAYFHELDFSKVSVLEETYHSLNGQLNHSMMRSPNELLFGLSPRQLVTTFHHKILILFKLILLEKKVLFYKSPVRELCATILTLCSLVPGMLEKGLAHCSLSVHPKNGRQHSTDMELSVSSADGGIAGDDEHLVLSSTECNAINDNNKCDNCNTSEKTLDLCVHSSSNNSQNVSKTIAETDSDDEINKWVKDHDSDDDLLKEIDEVLSINSNGSNIASAKSSPEKESPKPAANQTAVYDQMAEPKPENMDKISDTDRETPPLLKLPLDECGFPLELFSCGSYCHPYLSLTYLDVLTDVRVRSCLVGATNFLFKQKRDIFDVIVEIDTGKIDAVDSDLRKQLSLTTEDLRFVDYLVKTVITEKDRSSDKDNTSDLFNVDGNVDWEGSDDWIRYQFKLYLLHLLRSSELDDTTRDYLSFNASFMTAWRSTHNYKIWSSVSHPGVFEVNAGHPFSGHLSVSDMKLRLAHMMYSRSDQNKKINQTVIRTSKAVGGAITSAKSAVSSWWSNWSSASSGATPPPVVSSGPEKTADELKKSQLTEQETQL